MKDTYEVGGSVYLNGMWYEIIEASEDAEIKVETPYGSLRIPFGLIQQYSPPSFPEWISEAEWDSVIYDSDMFHLRWREAVNALLIRKYGAAK